MGQRHETLRCIILWAHRQRKPVLEPMKRLFDLILVTASLPILLPVMAVVAILVRRRMGAPVIFRQLRPGLHGEPFEMLNSGRCAMRRTPTAGRWLTPSG